MKWSLFYFNPFSAHWLCAIRAKDELSTPEILRLKLPSIWRCSHRRGLQGRLYPRNGLADLIKFKLSLNHTQKHTFPALLWRISTLFFPYWETQNVVKYWNKTAAVSKSFTLPKWWSKLQSVTCVWAYQRSFERISNPYRCSMWIAQFCTTQFESWMKSQNSTNLDTNSPFFLSRKVSRKMIVNSPTNRCSDEQTHYTFYRLLSKLY